MSAGIDPTGPPGRDGLDGQAGERVGRRGQDGDGSASGQRRAEGTGRVGLTLRRVDVLVDAARVVGEEVTGGIDDGGRAAVVDRQRMGAGAGEVAGVVDQEFGGGAGVAVNDLVVVADPEAVVGRGAARSRMSRRCAGLRSWNSSTRRKRHLAWAAARAVRIGQQDLYGPVDLLVEVDGAGLAQRGAVTVEALGDARRIGDGLFDQMRCGQAEPDGRQGLDVGGDGVGVGLPADLDEPLQQVAHGRLLEDTQAATPPELVADPQPEAVQGTDVESRSAVDVRAALPHFRGRLVVVRQRRDGGRVHAAFGDQVPEALGQHPGLSRARRGDHPGRPGAVVHGRQLVGCQIGGV